MYFDVHSLPEYGTLSGQRPDQMIETEKTDQNRPKRDPLDFTLWQGPRPGELSWPTPWGPGVSRLLLWVHGDGDDMPRPDVRHPRRRHRPRVPVAADTKSSRHKTRADECHRPFLEKDAATSRADELGESRMELP